MNILHIASQDLAGGGGGFTAGYRLHRNMLAYGLASRMLVSKKISEDVEVKYIPPKPKSLFREMANVLNRRINKNKKQSVKISDSKYYFNSLSESEIPYTSEYIRSYINHTPDAILLHWVQGFLDAEIIANLATNYECPVFWYMMDNAPMTGGCHYFWNCTGYQKSCGNCPALAESSKHDYSYRVLRKKKQYLESSNIIPVIPTQWQVDRLKLSSLFHQKSYAKISLAVDPDIFKPVEKKSLRQIFSLSEEKITFFFGSSDLRAKNKGMEMLHRTLEILSTHLSIPEHSKIAFLYAGKNPALFQNQKFPFEVHYAGVLTDDRALAMAYQVADAFICPSLEDAGPMMVNEALMTGIPVISFRVGIAQEIIEHLKNGLIAHHLTAESMADQITKFIRLKESERHDMAEHAREIALGKLHPKIQVEKFMELIHDKRERP